MNEISPDQLLSQIRSLSQNLQSPAVDSTPAATGFGEMLKTSLNAVNDAQQHAKELKIGFETGNGDSSYSE